MPPRKGDQLLELRVRGPFLHIDELMERHTECSGEACKAVERDRFLAAFDLADELAAHAAREPQPLLTQLLRLAQRPEPRRERGAQPRLLSITHGPSNR